MPSPSWRRYVRFWGTDIDADLDDEFRFHLEAEVEELVAHGLSADAARREALQRFGNINLSRRHCRSADQRRMERERRKENLSVLRQDTRYALRSLRRQPAFTTIAVITLALGIGATTAIFSVINGVLLKPLPYREPDRLVMLWETMKGGDRVLLSYPDYLDWRRRQRGFEDVAVFNPFPSFTITGQGDPVRVRGALVSGNYFQLLGISPRLGRLITAPDDQLGSARVVILSDGFFESRFGGDRSVLGRTLLLDGDAYTIAGVLPPEVRDWFQRGNPDVILPVGLFATGPIYARESHPGLLGVARLKHGVTLERALADLQRVSAELQAEYPKQNSGIGSGGAPMIEMIVGRIKPALRMLMIAVAFVLLIACANVASLVLSRSGGRQREFAVRRALGAARGRIVQQLLTESIALALLGGVLGVVIAVAGVRFLVALDPGSVPRLMNIQVDRTVLLFALGVSLGTGLLFGLAPALQSGRGQLATALKDGGRTSAGASRQRTRAILTVAEVALALVLLAGSGLLMRSFAKLLAVDPGFQSSHIVAGVVRLPTSKYPKLEQARAAVDELLARVRAIPGVEMATIGSDLPITTNWQTTISIESRPEPDASKLPLVNAAVVDPTYFEILKIPIVSGRRLTAEDGPRQPLVVVIGERIAKKLFPNTSPIGQRIKQGQANDSSSWRTIVGVVKDTRTDGLTEDPRGTFYLPRSQEEMHGGWLIVRGTIPPEQLTALLRHAVAEVDRDMPLAQARTMDAALEELVQEPKFSMLLLTLFAGVALVLASVGIYGVISYNVTQRRSEIGVRVALGAQRRDVVGLIVGQAIGVVAIGIVIGVLLALWGGKSLSSMLFGVGPRDPLVLGGASLVLLAIALVAAVAPALRASRIDPTIAIRAD